MGHFLEGLLRYYASILKKNIIIHFFTSLKNTFFLKNHTQTHTHHILYTHKSTSSPIWLKLSKNIQRIFKSYLICTIFTQTFKKYIKEKTRYPVLVNKIIALQVDP